MSAPSCILKRIVGLLWGLAMSAGCAASTKKLEVSFFRPFWGDYWIIDLSEDYSYAVVGHPGRDYLWILACAPTMAESTYQSIVARLQAQGYETSRLVRTLQVAAPPSAGGPRSPEGS